MEIGEKYLITCDQWFVAPDGNDYRAVFGTVHGVDHADEALGVRTNAKSTNWYVRIGNMVVAGCQIHYAVRTDAASKAAPLITLEHEGKLSTSREGKPRIFFADD